MLHRGPDGSNPRQAGGHPEFVVSSMQDVAASKQGPPRADKSASPVPRSPASQPELCHLVGASPFWLLGLKNSQRENRHVKRLRQGVKRYPLQLRARPGQHAANIPLFFGGSGSGLVGTTKDADRTCPCAKSMPKQLHDVPLQK